MVGFPAARLTDLHLCPMVTPGLPPIPHIGGPVIGPCAPTVLIGGLPAARMTDMCTCVGPPDTIMKGSATVLTMTLPQTRILVDSCAHGGIVLLGCFTVLVGDAAGGGGGGGAGAPGTEKAALLARIAAGESNITIEGDPEFVAATMVALAKLATSPTGFALLQSLEASRQPVTIRDAGAGNGSGATRRDGSKGLMKADGTPGAPVGTIIDWDRTESPMYDGSEPWQTTDDSIILGHELIHANHNATGTNRGRTNVAYTGLDGSAQTAPREEVATVGLAGYENEPFTENKLRRDYSDIGIGSQAGRPGGSEPPRDWY